MADDAAAAFAPPTVFQVSRLLKKQLRAERISHLRSIALDADFVQQTHAAHDAPPLFANLRCGAWYASPALRRGECYFKSTDGHAGAWEFSLSRINLAVALAAARHGCAMIVDSTRRGKRFPDALTKTVPIWCAVINRAVAEERGGGGAEWAELRLPPWVPPSEAAQIEARLGGWVAALRRPALRPVLDELVRALERPLAPSWISPNDAPAPQAADAAAPFSRVLCVTASRVMSAEASREVRSWTYVQGAADDHENWSRGLSAAQWWAWHEPLMRAAATSSAAAEDELCRLQAEAADEAVAPHGGGAPTALWRSGLLLAAAADASAPAVWEHADAVLDVGACSRAESLGADGARSYLHVALAAGKRAQPSKHWWQTDVLPAALGFARAQLRRGRRVVVTCDDGVERAPAVALAALIALYDGDGVPDVTTLRAVPPAAATTKEALRARLALLQGVYPAANVPRHIMKELNNFFVAATGGWSRLVWGDEAPSTAIA